MDPADVPIFIVKIIKLSVYLMGLLMIGVLFARVLRSRQIPRCVCCGASQVRPSRPEFLLERLGKFLRIEPHRCDSCSERFYAVMFRGPQVQKAFKITVRRRDGEIRLAFRRIVLEPAQPVRQVRRRKRKPGAIAGNPAILHT